MCRRRARVVMLSGEVWSLRNSWTIVIFLFYVAYFYRRTLHRAGSMVVYSMGKGKSGPTVSDRLVEDSWLQIAQAMSTQGSTIWVYPWITTLIPSPWNQRNQKICGVSDVFLLFRIYQYTNFTNLSKLHDILEMQIFYNVYLSYSVWRCSCPSKSISNVHRSYLVSLSQLYR